MTWINRLGEKFDLLTISKYITTTKVECICECGNKIVTTTPMLMNTGKTHCGSIECRRKLMEIRKQFRGR